jgi:hypothetical protein
MDHAIPGPAPAAERHHRICPPFCLDRGLSRPKID